MPRPTLFTGVEMYRLLNGTAVKLSTDQSPLSNIPLQVGRLVQNLLIYIDKFEGGKMAKKLLLLFILKWME